MITNLTFGEALGFMSGEDASVRGFIGILDLILDQIALVRPPFPNPTS